MTDRKLLRFGIIIVLVFLFLSLLLMKSLSVSEPLFLKSYRELIIYEDSNYTDYQNAIELEYITNFTDTYNSIESVLLVDDTNKYYETHLQVHDDLSEKHSIYKTKKYSLFLKDLDIFKESDKITFNQAVIYFFNGQKIYADIGSTTFLNDIYAHSEYLEFSKSESGSNKLGYNTSVVLKDINKLTTSSSVLDNFSLPLNITVNNLNYFDKNELDLNEGDKLHIKYELSDDIDIETRLSNYEILMLGQFIDKDKEVNVSTSLIQFRREALSTKNIYKLIKARGASK